MAASKECHFLVISGIIKKDAYYLNIFIFILSFTDVLVLSCKP